MAFRTLTFVAFLILMTASPGLGARRRPRSAKAAVPSDDESDLDMSSPFDDEFELDVDALAAAQAKRKVVLPAKASFAKRIRDPQNRERIARFGGEMQRRFTESVSEAAKRSSGVFREVKGFLSSELEAVILKSCRPNENGPKPKHVEALLGATHDTPGHFDIYPHILKKVWNRMVEKDWRCVLKATHLLHRFAADGAMQHSKALQKTLRNLGRQYCTRHRNQYFNTEQVEECDYEINPPEEYAAQRADFVAAYFAYTHFRALNLGPSFPELFEDEGSDNRQLVLSARNLKVCKRLVRLGTASGLKRPEVLESELCSVCIERVCRDLHELMELIGKGLTREMKRPAGERSENFDAWLKWYNETAPALQKWLRSISRPLANNHGISIKRSIKRVEAAASSE